MNTDAPQVPAGWYPDSTPGQERYWDGLAWTEHIRPVASLGVTAPAPTLPFVPLTETSMPTLAASPDAAAATTSGRVTRKRKLSKPAWIVLGSVGGLVLLLGIIGALNGAGKTVDEASTTKPVASATAEEAADTAVKVPDVVGLTAKEADALLKNAGLESDFAADKGVVLDRDNWTVMSTVPAADADVKAGDTIVVNVVKTAALKASAEPEKPADPPAPSEPQYTLAQQNAIDTAKSYLSFSGFSRSGLIDQLEFEGYATADATFASDNAGADWNVECAESAKEYMNVSSFSRSGLHDQLAFEGFTEEQITFGLQAVGY